ncbi:MAG: sensor histidine kinase, partial [Burkholderiaceae bacterium]
RIRGFVKRSDPIRKLVDPSAILTEALGLAEIDARGLGVEIQQRVSQDLPQIYVDPILIEQVLINLLKNGVESMRDTDERLLEVTVEQTGSMILFVVADRGSGVADEIRERLFDSFYTTKTEGMGMGLNICRSIIEGHRGRLWFEDRPNGGSRFCFSIPLDVAQPLDESDQEEEE